MSQVREKGKGTKRSRERRHLLLLGLWSPFSVKSTHTHDKSHKDKPINNYSNDVLRYSSTGRHNNGYAGQWPHTQQHQETLSLESGHGERKLVFRKVDEGM